MGTHRVIWIISYTTLSVTKYGLTQFFEEKHFKKNYKHLLLKSLYKMLVTPKLQNMHSYLSVFFFFFGKDGLSLKQRRELQGRHFLGQLYQNPSHIYQKKKKPSHEIVLESTRLHPFWPLLLSGRCVLQLSNMRFTVPKFMHLHISWSTSKFSPQAYLGPCQSWQGWRLKRSQWECANFNWIGVYTTVRFSIWLLRFSFYLFFLFFFMQGLLFLQGDY